MGYWGGWGSALNPNPSFILQMLNCRLRVWGGFGLRVAGERCGPYGLGIPDLGSMFRVWVRVEIAGLLVSLNPKP